MGIICQERKEKEGSQVENTKLQEPRRVGACGPCRELGHLRQRWGGAWQGREASLDGQVGRGQVLKCPERYSKEFDFSLVEKMGLEENGLGGSRQGPFLLRSPWALHHLIKSVLSK